MGKYELTDNYKIVKDIKVYQIRAIKDFGFIKKGELGGFIEREENLSNSGNAWVGENAVVSENARVGGNAEVRGTAVVRGNARINKQEDYATISGFGSKNRTTTFYRCEDKKIEVICGCFAGTIEEFRKKVKEAHGENKFAKEYIAIADLMEMHFEQGQDRQQ